MDTRGPRPYSRFASPSTLDLDVGPPSHRGGAVFDVISGMLGLGLPALATAPPLRSVHATSPAFSFDERQVLSASALVPPWRGCHHLSRHLLNVGRSQWPQLFSMVRAGAGFGSLLPPSLAPPPVAGFIFVASVPPLATDPVFIVSSHHQPAASRAHSLLELHLAVVHSSLP